MNTQDGHVIQYHFMCNQSHLKGINIRCIGYVKQVTYTDILYHIHITCTVHVVHDHTKKCHFVAKQARCSWQLVPQFHHPTAVAAVAGGFVGRGLPPPLQRVASRLALATLVADTTRVGLGRIWCNFAVSWNSISRLCVVICKTKVNPVLLCKSQFV